MAKSKTAKPAAKGPVRPGASATARPSRIPPRHESAAKYHADQAATHAALAKAYRELARKSAAGK